MSYEIFMNFNYKNKTGFSFSSLSKPPLKNNKMSKFYPQIRNIEARLYICDRLLTEINVTAIVCVCVCDEFADKIW